MKIQKNHHHAVKCIVCGSCAVCVSFIWRNRICLECHLHPLRNQKTNVLYNAIRREGVNADAAVFKTLKKVLKTSDHPSTRPYSFNSFLYFRTQEQWTAKNYREEDQECMCKNCKK